MPSWRMRDDSMRQPVGCLIAVAFAVVIPIGDQFWWSVQNARATAEAMRRCNMNDTFEIRDPTLVRHLLIARTLPANRGKALVDTPIEDWHFDVDNPSFATSSFEAQVNGKAAFIVHDVAVRPRSLLEPFAGIKIMSFHCLHVLNSPLTDLVFAR